MAQLIWNEKDLVENYRKLQAEVGQVRIMVVLKADGYGLGLDAAASALIQAGCKLFAVSRPEDAMRLRERDADCGILLLSPVRALRLAEQLIRRRITLFLCDKESVLTAEIAAQNVHMQAGAHLFLDTGLGRHGFSWENTKEIISILRLLQFIRIEGCGSHLACASSLWDRRILRQYVRFVWVTKELQDAGIDPGMRHLCSSSTFLHHPEMRMDAVRLGSVLLGRGEAAKSLGLARVGHLEGVVEAVYDRKAGTRVGYGRGVRLDTERRIAVVSIGYCDGFDLCTRRSPGGMLSLFQKLPKVMIRGEMCPVIGRVGCVSTMVDVTKIACQSGDPVMAPVNPLLVRRE